MRDARVQRSFLIVGGKIIRSLADVRDFISSLPEDDQRQDKWRELSDLLATTDGVSDTEIIAEHLRDALGLPASTVIHLQDDNPKKPPAPSARKRSLQERKRLK